MIIIYNNNSEFHGHFVQEICNDSPTPVHEQVRVGGGEENKKY